MGLKDAWVIVYEYDGMGCGQRLGVYGCCYYNLGTHVYVIPWRWKR